MLQAKLAEQTRERDEALCLLAAHVAVDSDKRHVEILDMDDVDYADMPFDPFEVYEAAGAALKRLKETGRI